MLLQFAIKTFDLVVALTRGGPGISTTFPANYVYDLMFQRGEIAVGAAAAIMMLAALAVVLVPYALWTAWRSAPRGAPMVDATFDLALDSQAREREPSLSLGRVAIYAFLERVRAHLSAAAVRRRRQFVSRIAGDHAERTDRAAAQLLA